MRSYNFSEVEAGVIENLVAEFAVRTSVDKMYENGALNPSFLAACRIICELQKPTDINTVVPARFDIGFADSETVAIPAYDPRASNPHCVHGVPFKDEKGKEAPCERCAANWTDERFHVQNDSSVGEHALREAQSLSGANRDE